MENQGKFGSLTSLLFRTMAALALTAVFALIVGTAGGWRTVSTRSNGRRQA